MNRTQLAQLLHSIYEDYHKPELIQPDPLQLVYNYSSVEDREFAALVASSLAYGRVVSILDHASSVLRFLGDTPWKGLQECSDSDLREGFMSFKHRFTTGSELANTLIRLKRWCADKTIGEKIKSLADDDPVSCHEVLATAITEGRSTLFSKPSMGSCCKRGMLFWRWMVRQDAVDPGGWNFMNPAKLLVPLDTHLFAFARYAKLTKRKSPNLSVAREVTKAFGRVCPEDPTKFDFSLTRFGIHPALHRAELEARIKKR